MSFILRNLTTHLNFHFWAIQTRNLEPDFVPPEEHTNEFDFRTLTPDEILIAAQNPELGITQAFVHSAFARGDICTTALHGESLVACSWKTLSRAPVAKRLWICIDQQPQFYGYKAFVLPKYRGQRLSTSVAKASDAELVKAGAKWGVSYKAISNLESRAVNFRNDNSTLRGYAGYWKIGSRCFSFRTPGAKPFISFERSKTNIPV